MINYTSQKITKVLGLIAMTGLAGLINAQTLDWKPAGPVYNAGRARNMIVDKSNSQVLYVGSASSGIFKSTDGGANWGPINDQATIRNISYMAQSIDGSILVATGEGFLRTGQKSKAQAGTGLYKLDETANPPALNLVVSSSVVGNVINRVACNPNNTSHIALATNSGIWTSINGTAGPFTQATLPGAPTGGSGQDVKFDGNGILYCSIGIESGTATAVTASKVYKAQSVNFGLFSEITPTSSVLPDNFHGRIELAIAPSDNNVIYASCANKFLSDNTATLKGLFVSYDGGTNWALLIQGSSQLDPLSNGGTVATGDYSQVLSVNPSNAHQLFIGGYSFYVWTRNNNSNTNPIGDWVQLGQSFFSNFQYYLHQNIHDIKLVPGNPSIFYFTTDAGVFRSIDLAPLLGNLAYNYNIGNLPSFQPFYKGMITGQFNSVSIERYPIGTGIGATAPGSQVTPYSGFIGGTGGNGLNYFSGTFSVVTQEISYIGGEVYNSEYSKILPNAAFATRGNGDLYRSTNIKTSPPNLVNVNKYSGIISKISPTSEDFVNNGLTTGTPFKLFEYYGQKGIVAPDSATFYNDTVRYQASMAGITELTTKTSFTFSTARPNQYALIDSVVVRTGTVQLPITGLQANLQTPFNGPNDGQTIYTTLPPNYTVSPTGTTAVTAMKTVGASTVPVTFTLNTATLLDNFTVNFPMAPFATKTVVSYPAGATGTSIIVPDAAVYYRVFATVYYRYKAGDIVRMVDNNISTRTTSYSAVTTNSLSWRYGTTGLPSYTITNTSTVAVTNPTYVLLSNAALNTTTTQSTPTFTVRPYGTTTYTIQQYGTYTVNVTPVVYTVGIDPYSYTIAANNATTATSLTYTLQAPGPGTTVVNSTQSGTNIVVFTVTPTSTNVTTYTIVTPAGATTTSQTFTFAPTTFSINPSLTTTVTTAPNIYIVHPTVTTTYSLTQTTGTLSQTTYSTIGTTTYVLNPGNVIQQNDSNVFVVNTGTTPVTYTLVGLSSNTLSGLNTSMSYTFPISTTSIVTFPAVPLNPNNTPVRTPAFISSRIAMILNNGANTGNADAIAVSKNPLALNDALSFVRVSQCFSTTPVWTDNSSGVATNNTITVLGKPTLLEWSKSGTEIYFATVPTTTTGPATYRLYRVSHITTIMDLSPSSYSGKFYTDIFKYAAPVNNVALNPASPYRTTLIGTFDKPVTSISVSNDSKNLAVTFNSTNTGTTSTIMYNANDASKSDMTNIGWAGRQGSLPSTVVVTYCSMMEKNDSKKFFLGTDNGMYYTSDISASSPVWSNVNDNTNSKLPNVQIFDIKQQNLDAWDCYNSGQIYVATYGRGIWTNGSFLAPYTVGVEENQNPVVEGKNLVVYPNPTNGNVFVSFNGVDGETASVQVMDISGRVVQTEDLGKLSPGEVTHSFSTNTLSSGVYIVNIQSDSGVKRVTKLIVTK